MALIELIFDRHIGGFRKKRSCAAVEVRPIDPPKEVEAFPKHDIEHMIEVYGPKGANAYCHGIKTSNRAIVQYYKIISEFKNEYPSGTDHHINTIRH